MALYCAVGVDPVADLRGPYSVDRAGILHGPLLLVLAGNPGAAIRPRPPDRQAY